MLPTIALCGEKGRWRENASKGLGPNHPQLCGLGPSKGLQARDPDRSPAPAGSGSRRGSGGIGSATMATGSRSPAALAASLSASQRITRTTTADDPTGWVQPQTGLHQEGISRQPPQPEHSHRLGRCSRKHCACWDGRDSMERQWLLRVRKISFSMNQKGSNPYPC